MELLALGDAKLKLGNSPRREIELQGDERHALALNGGGEFPRLVLSYENLPHATRLMIEAVRHQVFGDIGVHEENLAILRLRIGLSDIGLARAQALHLASHQDKSCLEGRLDEIEMARFSLFRHDPLPVVLLLFHPSP